MTKVIVAIQRIQKARKCEVSPLDGTMQKRVSSFGRDYARKGEFLWTGLTLFSW